MTRDKRLGSAALIFSFLMVLVYFWLFSPVELSSSAKELLSQSKLSQSVNIETLKAMIEVGHLESESKNEVYLAMNAIPAPLRSCERTLCDRQLVLAHQVDFDDWLVEYRPLLNQINQILKLKPYSLTKKDALSWLDKIHMSQWLNINLIKIFELNESFYKYETDKIVFTVDAIHKHASYIFEKENYTLLELMVGLVILNDLDRFIKKMIELDPKQSKKITALSWYKAKPQIDLKQLFSRTLAFEVAAVDSTLEKAKSAGGFSNLGEELPGKLMFMLSNRNRIVNGMAQLYDIILNDPCLVGDISTCKFDKIGVKDLNIDPLTARYVKVFTSNVGATLERAIVKIQALK